MTETDSKPTTHPRAVASTDEVGAVVDAVLRYTRGLDLADAELLESALTDDTVVDLGPAIARIGAEFPALTPRSAVVDGLISAVGPMDTSHSITNARVLLDGDSARLSCYAQAQHYPSGNGPNAEKPRHAMMMNYYDARLVRSDVGGGPGWRIRSLVIDNLWFEGDPTVLMP